jgi:3',5'-cyclic AMP phosphodiesterase CpdA
MFLLAHITDPHLGPLPEVRRRDLISKRALGYMNWHRNRAHGFNPDVLAALVADMAEHKPDHIAVTGDLVNLALASEFAAAHDWLSKLGTPETVTVVPGNHDAYVLGAFDEGARLWKKFMGSDGDPEEIARFPFVRRRDSIAIVGLSSAVPSLPLMATGVIEAKQAKSLGTLLDDLGRENLFRVVLIHHPPIEGSTSWQKRLIGAGLFRAEIAKHGAELILHGHNHHTIVGHIAGKDGDVPVVGGSAASTAPRIDRPGGSYNLFRIEKKGGKFTCAMTERGIRIAGAPVETFLEQELTG